MIFLFFIIILLLFFPKEGNGELSRSLARSLSFFLVMRRVEESSPPLQQRGNAEGGKGRRSSRRASRHPGKMSRGFQKRGISGRRRVSSAIVPFESTVPMVLYSSSTLSPCYLPIPSSKRSAKLPNCRIGYAFCLETEIKQIESPSSSTPPPFRLRHRDGRRRCSP